MCSKQSNDLVRQEYKRYKRKKPPPDFNDVIDLNCVGKFQEKLKRKTVKVDGCLEDACCRVGLKSPATWEAYWVNASPGFMIVKNPFSSSGQNYWTHRALTEYTRKPYPCNLDVHMKLDEAKTVWEISKEESPSDPYIFMERLRWSHLGYHFDYNYVNYKEEKYYGFPDDLTVLMKTIAKVLGFENYSPETAIVNYYPLGSSMGGHTDHYEEELSAPLLSMSFGQAAVFLIGGKTKDIKPEAVWIRSGDVLMMSGESRVAYHAVPCIVKEGIEGQPPEPLQFLSKRTVYDAEADLKLKAEDKDYGLISQKKQIPFHADCYCSSNVEHFDEHLWTMLKLTEQEWEPFADYLSKTRININVRQVHKRQQEIDQNSLENRIRLPKLDSLR